MSLYRDDVIVTSHDPTCCVVGLIERNAGDGLRSYYSQLGMVKDTQTDACTHAQTHVHAHAHTYTQ